MLIFTFTLVPAFPVYSATTAELEQRTVELEKEVNDLNSKVINLNNKLDNQRKELNQQTLQYQFEQYIKFVENERASNRWFINWYFKVLTGLISALAVILAFFFGKSFKDVIKDLKFKAKTQLQEQFDATSEELFNREVKEIKARVDSLKTVVNREASYTNTRILVTGTAEELEQMNKNELDVLKKRGIDRILLKEINVLEIKELNNIDVIVFRYDDGEIADLQKIVDFLREKQDSIPLILYTPGRLKEDANKIVNTYMWTTFANSSVTLVSNIFTIVHAFADVYDKEGKI